MAAMFFQVLCLMDQVASVVDPISNLPTELVSNIFRYLDPKSITAASSVNRRWSSVCKSDRVLRNRIRRQLRQERKQRQRAYFQPSSSVEVVRPEPGVLFGRRNGQVSCKALPVVYDNVNNVTKTQQSGFKISRSLTENNRGLKIAKSCSATAKSASKKTFTYSRLRL